MPKHTALYSTNYGLEGCYMPDSHGGSIECTTRRDLAAFIRGELAQYEMPACLFNDVGITRLWSQIKRHGSSCMHFRLTHKGNTLRFCGLTREEYEADQAAD